MNEKRAVLSSQTPEESKGLSRGKNPRRRGFDWTLVNEVVSFPRRCRSAPDEIVVLGAVAFAIEFSRALSKAVAPISFGLSMTGSPFRFRTADCNRRADAGVSAHLAPGRKVTSDV